MDRLDELVKRVEPKVIEWRRDIHQNPELPNREFRTSALVEKHLRSLGLEVKTKVAHTGVVGLLRGPKPGPVVALRADMDALPVVEEVNLPFASKVKSTWEGNDCGVMHACGHDVHTSVLMGVAEILSQIRSEISGTVKFIFQPAEEMPEEGEEGGAALMIKEGVLENPSVDAIFGLHVVAGMPTNLVGYRSGPLMASNDNFSIKVQGKQAHGALPWLGVDPVVISSQIILGLQTIPSRQLDITITPSLLSVTTVHGGIRHNIIPDHVTLTGTIRTFEEQTRDKIHQKLVNTCQSIAKASGGEAHVNIKTGYDVTVNHEELTAWSAPILKKVIGEERVQIVPTVMGAEDFSAFQQKVPGFFFFVGCSPDDHTKASSNHSPLFFVDEKCVPVCIKSMTALALSYLSSKVAPSKL